MINIADLIAAFEAGSGLNLNLMSIVFSLIGAAAVIGGCAYHLIQLVPQVASGRMRQSKAYGHALAAMCILVFCLAMFTASSPLAP
jgi:hypothetical protein